MTPNKSDVKPDMYIYDIPTMTRHNLCQNILQDDVWVELAEHMGFDKSDIDDIKNTSVESNDREADELLVRWGEQNHTVTELFVLLSRMRSYEAMHTIKGLVDKRYHKLIGRIQTNDLQNDDEDGAQKRTTKLDTMSEKILNGPIHSTDNNESDRLLGDKRFHGDKLDVNECAGGIARIDYEILRDATNNWSDRNLLGKGGFASVYKGMWISTPVAIKRIENRAASTREMGKIQVQQSLNELRHLNSCRHDNILPLYGISVNGPETCFVCQLMQGGSLEQRLFRRPPDVPPLTWRQRINIAGGVARGLQFLHTFQKRPRIHGDIKPGNILLDPCSQPKIGDFGLVREGNENETIVSCAYGTRPYLPPEFLVYKKLTTKVDSFSFGIVLFELSTGLRALDARKKSFLIKIIKSHCADDKLLSLIDHTAGNVEDKETIFKTLVDLGMDCTKDNYEERLDMVKVLKFFEENFYFSS
ncbi:Serine/threonine-protein kinase pelle [Pseudolycoriella hygida]|uniref:non-specific serine/threonine protein kinase n=1 Tax=Pseudolycoriella hygida TaxID=35572 RepID=A0A9Q0N0Z1_9DIPT|nr:Serine/threonine-protein kinase pelle [Pseudolycoriella hygida]